MNHRLLAKASILALGAAIALPSAALAQGAAGALRDEILVTATKQANAENVQDVPLAVTAYGAEQLDALKVRDLSSLSYSMPNVSLDDIGTARGVANFSIRGLGINSSIPSIDPTVGVFVDGMYLGINGGVVLDIFDMESVEVLRGPQGILFGRNTTGGAVLINTKKPTDEWEANFKGSAESGLRGTGFNYTAMGSIGGPIVEDVLRAKVAVYYNKDNGWFKNYLGGPFPNAVASVALAPVLGAATPIVFGPGTDAFEDFGGAETLLVRPSIYWTATALRRKTIRTASARQMPFSLLRETVLLSPLTSAALQIPSGIRLSPKGASI
jgi:iron complex outermembrane receptor protein